VAYDYVPLGAVDEVRWQRRVRRELGLPPDAPIPWGLNGVSDDARRAAIESWRRIFDVDPASGCAVQATVEHLYLDDVVDTLPAPALKEFPREYRVHVSTYLRRSL